jgi:predicted RNase H-like HicB family nuclease
MNLYTVVAERSGNWWAVSVPDIPGVFTQARRLDQVEEMARDAIALMLDVPADSFKIGLDVTPPKNLRERIEEAKRMRAMLERNQQAAAASLADAVDASLECGLTVRDAGRLLGVSPQRVSQVAHRKKRLHSSQ